MRHAQEAAGSAAGGGGALKCVMFVRVYKVSAIRRHTRVLQRVASLFLASR